MVWRTHLDLSCLSKYGESPRKASARCAPNPDPTSNPGLRVRFDVNYKLEAGAISTWSCGVHTVLVTCLSTSSYLRQLVHEEASCDRQRMPGGALSAGSTVNLKLLVADGKKGVYRPKVSNASMDLNPPETGGFKFQFQQLRCLRLALPCF